MPDLSLVLVAHGNAAQLRDTLTSVERHTRAAGYELIVVDNASDEAVAAVAGSFGARVLRPGRNLGFAGGSNLGLSQARGRYACLLNPDVVLLDDALGSLVDWLEQHPAAGGAAPVLLRPDGTPQPYSYGDAPSPMYLLRRLAERRRGRHLHSWAGGAARPVGWAAGTCLVVRLPLARSIGPLDEQFFLYWEDVDWGLRFRERGFPLWLLPSVAVMHIGGASVGPAAVEHYDRSLVRFTAKWHGGPAAAAAFWALRVYRIGRLASPGRTSLEPGHTCPG